VRCFGGYDHTSQIFSRDFNASKHALCVKAEAIQVGAIEWFEIDGELLWWLEQDEVDQL
jgi:hypothetical protein